MAELEIRVRVNTDNNFAYRVSINDGGPDGGTGHDLIIGGDVSSIPTEQIEGAVSAFADAIIAPPWTLNGVTRISGGETAL